MAYNYSAKAEGNSAKAVGVSLPISTKQSIMICNMLRGKNVQVAKDELEKVAKLQKAVPFTRFNKDMGHRKGNMAGGRFPQKACTHILSIIKSAESNAQFKGLSSTNLIISHISAQQGPKIWRHGRQSRRQAKRTHIEIIVQEMKKAAKEKTSEKKEVKKPIKTPEKKETKNEVKKPEPKKEVKAEKKVEKKKEAKPPAAETKQ